MPVTYKKIASVTVGSGGASSIDFSSIPSTFDDLVVKVSARTNRSAISEPIGLRPNGATTNLTLRLLEGNGSTAASATATYGYIGAASAATGTTNTFSNVEAYIPNYAGSTNKSISADGVQENNSGAANDAFQDLSAILWSNTAAITSISLVPNSGGSFVQYSTATLYGVSKS